MGKKIPRDPGFGGGGGGSGVGRKKVRGEVGGPREREMEVSSMGSSIVAEHRVFLGAALRNFLSAETRIREAFKGLYQGFEVTFGYFSEFASMQKAITTRYIW